MTARVIAPKNTIAAALLLAAAGFITSLLIEHVGLLVPCELCLIQRWSVFAAVLFLGVSLRSRGHWLSVSGCAGAALATLASLAAAVRHVWLQTHPGEPLGCLPDLFGRSAAAAPAPNPVSDLAALASPLQGLTSTCVWRITDFPRISNSPHTGQTEGARLRAAVALVAGRLGLPSYSRPSL
ncbi:MAG TPA: disulfide bond formation protein B [Candidatus Binataceae bacterium]|nr:disulfide bond formation protein B [Candidatus Binataceae bacterium]